MGCYFVAVVLLLGIYMWCASVFKCLAHVKVTFMNAMNTQVIPGEYCVILRLLILFTLWFLIMQRYSHDLSLNTAHTFLPPQVDVLHPLKCLILALLFIGLDIVKTFGLLLHEIPYLSTPKHLQPLLFITPCQEAVRMCVCRCTLCSDILYACQCCSLLLLWVYLCAQPCS